MKSILNFSVIFTVDEDGWYVADCPSIPGCHSQGKTFEEAEKNIEEAIQLCLIVAKDDKEFRSSIQFPQTNTRPFIGIRDIPIEMPQYL